MWSLGCIIAEMYTGYPIFPGENEQEQLACIMEVMGLPDKYLVDRSSRKRLFFGKSPTTLAPLRKSLIVPHLFQTLLELLVLLSIRKVVVVVQGRKLSLKSSKPTTSSSSISSRNA